MSQIHRRLFRRSKDRSGKDEHSASESESEVKSTTDLTPFQGQKVAPARPDSEGTSKSKVTSFWTKAYENIIDDEDMKTRRMLEAYNALLERARNTDTAIHSSKVMHTEDTHSKRADIISKECRNNPLTEGKNEDHSAESEQSDPGSILTELRAERVFGDEVKMREVVQKSLEGMQQKEWVMSWHGNVFEVRDQVTRIVGIVQKMSGFVKAAADLSPYSGLAWAGVCVLLPVSST